MATVSRGRHVAVDPEAAWRLWTDPRRWPAFVEGFSGIERHAGDWPRAGARVDWASTPGGRGRVSEEVVAAEPPHRVVTRVREDAMRATQTVTFEPRPDQTWVGVELDYELTAGGPLRPLTDVLFIRRALAAALDRTLARFAAEAAEQAAR